METFQHNRVKQCIGSALLELGRREKRGSYFLHELPRIAQFSQFSSRCKKGGRAIMFGTLFDIVV